MESEVIMWELENRCLRRCLNFVEFCLYNDNTVLRKKVALSNFIDLLNELLGYYCEVLENEEAE